MSDGTPDGAPQRARADAARSIIIACTALLLAAAWLWAGVDVAAGLVERAGFAGAAGEALFTAAVFSPLLLLAVLLGRVARAPALRWGARPLRSIGGGAAVGFAALSLAILYLALAGTLRMGASTSPTWVLAGLLVIGLQVLAEEALFRGLVQPALVRGMGVPAGVVLTAAAFAGLHLLAAGASNLALVNLFLGGLLFGALALGRGSVPGIAAAWGAHWAWNGGEQLLWGLDPNPGVGAFGALWNLDAIGAPHWGGSDEGLNGSWAMFLALAAVTLPRVLSLLRANRAVVVDPIPPRAKAH